MSKHGVETQEKKCYAKPEVKKHKSVTLVSGSSSSYYYGYYYYYYCGAYVNRTIGYYYYY